MTQVASLHRVLPTYARYDVTFTDGDGAWLVDADGKRYLDLFAGIAVVGCRARSAAPRAPAGPAGPPSPARGGSAWPRAQ